MNNRTALLLLNVGTPRTCGKKDISHFIFSMLSDRFVTPFPPFIARLFAFLGTNRSHQKYTQIWGSDSKDGSPLKIHMRNLCEKLEKKSDQITVFALRYGNPSIAEAFEELQRKSPSIEEVVIFPLFPQYAQSTTQTAIAEVYRIYQSGEYPFQLRIVDAYFDHPAYIQTCAMNIRNTVDMKAYDQLVVTFHSLPLNHIKKGVMRGKPFDYEYQIKETLRLLAEELSLPSEKVSLVFSSSRKGRWMRPKLEETIRELPALGCKKVVVCAPGFPIDNLETLFDIDILARRLFMENGGEKFDFVPSLNDSEQWVDVILKIAELHLVCNEMPEKIRL